MDGQVALERTAAVLRRLQPDIVGLQEVDSSVERSGRTAQAESLGTLLGMHHAFGGFFAYQGGQYGMAVLSRHPIIAVHAVRLPDGNEPRIALALRIRLPGGAEVMVVNVHFDWVEDDGFRYAQATALTRFLDSLAMPVILLGDFNDQPGSRTLGLFTGRFAEAPKPPHDRFTFSAAEPVKEIDFILAAPRSAWSAGPAAVIDERVASDHRPVAATLELAAAAGRP